MGWREGTSAARGGDMSVEGEKERARRGEERLLLSPCYSLTKPRVETLMNTGWAQLGLDTASVAPRFHVQPSHFRGDHTPPTPPSTPARPPPIPPSSHSEPDDHST